MISKPFTQEEVDQLLLLPEGVVGGHDDHASATLFDNQGVVEEVVDGACYMSVLTRFLHGTHGVTFFPNIRKLRKEGCWSMPEGWAEKYFKMLRYVRLLDRELSEIDFREGLPTLTLKIGIDYTYVYIAGCLYRLAESHSDVAYRLTNLYYQARKRGIKFLQCFLYVMKQEAIYNWNHFFFPWGNQEEYRRSPAFGNALWKLMRSSPSERAELLKNRTEGGVSEVIMRLHDDLMGENIVYLSNPLDILHPSIGTLYTNTRITQERFNKILADAPVEIQTLPERRNPYGSLRDYYY
jgi:hypothetical protein